MWAIALSFGTLWGVTCLYAVLRGGTPERVVAALFVAGALGTPLVDSQGCELYRGIEWGVLGLDTAMLAILLPLSIATARFWPMLMTSFQLAQVGTHVAAWFAPGALPAGYYAMTVWWSYPMLALLLAATRRHQIRSATFGTDPAWWRSLSSNYRAGVPTRSQLSDIAKR